MEQKFLFQGVKVPRMNELARFSLSELVRMRKGCELEIQPAGWLALLGLCATPHERLHRTHIRLEVIKCKSDKV